MRTQHNNGWRRCRLGDLVQIKHGYAFKGEFFSDSGPYVVLTPGNFHEEGGFREREEKEKYYVGPVEPEYILRKGDLIVAMTEQGEGLLGSSALIPKDGRFLHNQRLGLVVPLHRDECDTRFLYHVFNYREVRARIRASASGVKVRHTSPSRIGEVQVNVPPVGVQKRIADILCAYDDIIKNNERRITLLEETARAIYHEWFVEFRMPGVQLRKATSAEERLAEKGQLPNGWEARPFSGVADFVNGFAFAPEDWSRSGSPIVKIAELKNGITEKTPRFSRDDLADKYSVRNGDLLMSWSADLDVYIWMGGNGWLNQHLFNVLPHEGVSKWFLYHALKVGMPRFRRHEGIWALPPPYWDGETGRRAIRNLWRVPGK